MKSISITVTFLIFSTLSMGQNLIDTNKIWKVVETLNWGSSITNTYKFKSDTGINNQTYQKLFAATDSACTDWQLHTLMREDTSGKVYRFSDSAGEELVYNFDLQENDTIECSYYGTPIELTVDSIDMITLENGEVRKRLILTSYFYYGEEIWIEGIGSLNGLDFVGYNMITSDHWYELNCFTQNDTLKYNNPAYETCYYTTVGFDKIAMKHEFTVSPNPCQKKIFLNIDFPADKVYAIRIITPQGRVLMEKPALQTGQHTLDLKFRGKGVFLFQLFGNGRLLATKKLLKI